MRSALAPRLPFTGDVGTTRGAWKVTRHTYPSVQSLKGLRAVVNQPLPIPERSMNARVIIRKMIPALGSAGMGVCLYISADGTIKSEILIAASIVLPRRAMQVRNEVMQK